MRAYRRFIERMWVLFSVNLPDWRTKSRWIISCICKKTPVTLGDSNHTKFSLAITALGPNGIISDSNTKAIVPEYLDCRACLQFHSLVGTGPMTMYI